MPDYHYCGRATDELHVMSGEFSSTVKSSVNVSSIEGTMEGMGWDGADSYVAGQNPTVGSRTRLYRFSGATTTTVKNSLEYTTEQFGAGISWDGTNTLFTGYSTNKLRLLSGRFSSTLKTSELVSAIDGTVEGISWDGTDTPWCGSGDDKTYVTSGKFSSTLKTSASQAALVGTVDGVGPTPNKTNYYWLSADSNKAYLSSGYMTTTVKTSSPAWNHDPHDIDSSNRFTLLSAPPAGHQVHFMALLGVA